MEAQVHKYMKPKFPAPVLGRLVSGVQHLFTSNGICVLISLSLPTCKEHWAKGVKFLSNSAVLKRSKPSWALFGEIVRVRLLHFGGVWTDHASTAGGWSK